MEGGLTTANSFGGRTVAAVLFAAIGSGVLFALSLMLPLIGFLAAVVAPVPICVARLRSNRWASLFAVALTTLLATVVTNPLFGVWYLVQVGTIGLLLPELVLRGIPSSRTVIISAFFAFLVGVSAVIAMTGGAVLDAAGDLEQELSKATQQAVTLYQGQAKMQPDELALLTESMQQAAGLVTRHLPAMSLVAFGLVSATTLSVTARIARRQGVMVTVGSYNSFRTPEQLIWLGIAAGFAMLAAQDAVTLVASNILIPLAVLYGFQGGAVLSHYFSRSKLASVLRTMTLVLLVFQPYLLLILIAIGVFDLWFDFRKPRPKPLDE